MHGFSRYRPMSGKQVWGISSALIIMSKQFSRVLVPFTLSAAIYENLWLHGAVLGRVCSYRALQKRCSIYIH